MPLSLPTNRRAREASAVYEVPLQWPDTSVPECSGEPIPYAVEILNAKLCRRYCALLITGIAVAPSPEWLQDRLRSVGQRPVNNIVDITNYVLLELGHPLHAFDLRRLAGARIIVRTARSGESLKTLDGVDRRLERTHLVIADEKHAVALAGIMGGEESEISDSTTSVLLESAYFDPICVRRTARSSGGRIGTASTAPSAGCRSWPGASRSRAAGQLRRWHWRHQPIVSGENCATRPIDSIGPWQVWQVTPFFTWIEWLKYAKSGRRWTLIHSIGLFDWIASRIFLISGEPVLILLWQFMQTSVGGSAAMAAFSTDVWQ